MNSILYRKLLFVSTLFAIGKITAQPVALADAQQIACHSYAKCTHQDFANLHITAQRAFIRDKDTLMHLFQINENGFILVANEQRVAPILAYGLNGGTNLNEVPPAVAPLLEQYQHQIAAARHAKNRSKIHEHWADLRQIRLLHDPFYAIELPFDTKWGQSGFYKEACPRNANGVIAATGCTATAMAQLMKYYRHPAKGSGATFLEYNEMGSDNLYYTGVTASLQTYYDWAQMPNQAQQSNPDLATLMYDCGRAARSTYSASTTISSPNDAERALQDFFYYKTTLLRRQDTTIWFQTLRNELDSARPVLYAGYNGAVGHLWVCTGYNEWQQLKMNWGWNGSFDGFYHINALNPASVDLNSTQFMVTAKPIYPTLTLAGTMNAPAQLIENQSFRLQTIVKNTSNQDFQGDIAIVVQDTSGNDLSVLDPKIKHRLNATRWQFLTFNAPLLSYPTGNYQLGLRYKQWEPLSRRYEWLWMSSPLGFENPVALEVMAEKLSVSTQRIDFQYVGGESQLRVKSNVAWSISTNATWLTANAQQMNLFLQCAPNEGAARTAYLTVTGLNRSYQIEVTQAARSTIPSNSAQRKKSVSNVFPNPAREQITLQWRSEQPTHDEIMVVQNAFGQVVKTLTINILEGLNEQTIPTYDLPLGVYQARVGTRLFSFMVKD
jgi:Peptidase C10 family/Spi protease inhibitor/Putative binding domain, N-terminal